MIKVLENIKKEWRRKTYRRILTNRMTIVAYRLFRNDPAMHLAFICYRLKIDFGFTNAEICNFTGIPPSTVVPWLKTVRSILKSDVLHVLSTEDFEKSIEEWEQRRYYDQKIGYTRVESWFEADAQQRAKWAKMGTVQLGKLSETFFLKLLKEARYDSGAIHPKLRAQSELRQGESQTEIDCAPTEPSETLGEQL